VDNQNYNVWLSNSQNNTISENNVTDSYTGIYFYGNSYQNKFFHNNFVNNHLQVVFAHPSINIWNNDYPSGGNYWSDYEGADADGDGIGDTPYVIDDNNSDRYPLVKSLTLKHHRKHRHHPEVPPISSALMVILILALIASSILILTKNKEKRKRGMKA
jgi:parallel beta-helix repeat protein